MPKKSNIKKQLPKLKPFRVTELKIKENPEDFFRRFYKYKYASLLTCKTDKSNCNCAYIGINPFVKIKLNSKSAFEDFQSLLDFYSVKKKKYPVNKWGAIGYISYDAGKLIEKLPSNTERRIPMPLFQVVFYKDMFIFDKQKKKIYLVQTAPLDEDYSDIDLTKSVSKLNPDDLNIDIFMNHDSCSKGSYQYYVNQIKKYIEDGDVYEVNLSHRMRIALEDPFKNPFEPYLLFLKMYESNPAPFSSYLNFGEYKIMSNSPERFLKADGRNVETRPIKGTINRGKTKNSDLENKKALMKSKKDEAELSMIVEDERTNIHFL